MIEPPKQKEAVCDKCGHNTFSFPRIRGYVRPECERCGYVDMTLAPVERRNKADERQKSLFDFVDKKDNKDDRQQSLI